MSGQSLIRAWWNRQSLFRKTFMLLVLLITVVVGLVEGILEPFAKHVLLQASDGLQPWHEIILWGVTIIFPSLLCGFIFSRILTGKLNNMASAAGRLARGDFAARMPVDEQADDAFGKLGGSFNHMASSLEKLMENERRLLADISHELRSPLARMGISLELLPMKKGAARDELVGRLEKEVAAMSDLVGQLLTRGRERLSREGAALVDAGALFAEVADDIHFQGQLHGKEVACHVASGAGGALLVHGYAGQLRTLFANVAANALFYTPRGKSVTMRMERKDGTISVSVRDYGPGAPEDKLEDIFRAFYRVDDSRTRSSGGAGLGLTLAREAAETSGGAVTARNASPGLEILITLPVARAGQTAGNDS